MTGADDDGADMYASHGDDDTTSEGGYGDDGKEDSDGDNVVCNCHGNVDGCEYCECGCGDRDGDADDDMMMVMMFIMTVLLLFIMYAVMLI